MESGAKSRELKKRVVDKVGEVIAEISKANEVEQVIVALHSMAVLLLPTDTSLFIGSIDEHYREQVHSMTIPSENERSEWWQAFYRGAGFPTLARVLLLDVATNWLACFPFSAKRHVYDVFFINGLAIEVVQTLVVYLQHKEKENISAIVVHSNVERLLVQCLLENYGVLEIARGFDFSLQNQELNNIHLQPVVSRVAQIIASIPDRAKPESSRSLSSHSFFKQIITQILNVQEWPQYNYMSDKINSMTFVGEIFSRICRRGSSDVLLGEFVPKVLGHIRSVLSSSNNSALTEVFESDSGSFFWLKIMEAIRDPYAIERMCEQLLHQLEIERVTDSEAYWTLWILLDHVFIDRPLVRSLFYDKFLFWKVFPICCLRWIVQFSVLRCPPTNNCLTRSSENLALLDILQRLTAVWSKRDFVQTSSMEQQAYVTAAIGLCMETISREELDSAKDVMHSILQGVSCRLESPTDLIRKMASSIAFVFSRVIDPSKPLYLDESCTGGTVDWEFGLTKRQQGTLSNSNYTEKDTRITNTENDLHFAEEISMGKTVKVANKKSKIKLVDPDEIIDPASLNCESSSESDEDDVASESSDVSSDSSLQPYDLTDDDSDLQRKLPHLVDVIGALRKSDDAEGVETALNVVGKLVRASPDELSHIAGDLARALVQIRCSDLAVEGEEESAENKRQGALVALLVTCPLQSLDTLNMLLYSPNVDVSQRIMILDIMTEAAQELATSKIVKPREQRKVLVSTISENQPWFLPGTTGPPGASAWKEASEIGTPLRYSNRYERELPPKRGQIMKGKTRCWSTRSTNTHENQLEYTQNKFPVYAAAFMLPAMQSFDKKRHGVDLLGGDFIVLGKLIYTLGVCMRCISMHPEATVLAPPLMDMLRRREVCHHKEAYVRKAVLFAASCILISLHPSYVATVLTEGNVQVASGLEWIRTWALSAVETDVDRECYTMAMACLQLHSEMALQASRALESGEDSFKWSGKLSLASAPSERSIIKIPYSNVQL